MNCKATMALVSFCLQPNLYRPRISTQFHTTFRSSGRWNGASWWWRERSTIYVSPQSRWCFVATCSTQVKFSCDLDSARREIVKLWNIVEYLWSFFSFACASLKDEGIYGGWRDWGKHGRSCSLCILAIGMLLLYTTILLLDRRTERVKQRTHWVTCWIVIMKGIDLIGLESCICTIFRMDLLIIYSFVRDWNRSWW